MQSCQRSRVLLVALSPFGLSSSASPETAHFLALTLTCAREEYTPALLKVCSLSSTLHSNPKASSGVPLGFNGGWGMQFLLGAPGPSYAQEFYYYKRKEEKRY